MQLKTDFKIIQVNIFMGKYLRNLIKFLKKERPDFITMQEVTYGNLNKTGNPRQELFKILKRKLRMNGAFNEDIKIIGEPDGGMGNAVLTPHKILKTKILALRERRVWKPENFKNEKIIARLPRHVLDCVIKFRGRKIHMMSAHGAWTRMPVDTPEKIRQAKIIAKYLKYIKDPYILGGDLNMPPKTKVIKILNRGSNNLMLKTKIRQTTHPTLHKISPRGLLVDYIFTSNHFKPISIKAPLVAVSDHLPIIAKLKFASDI